MSLALEAREVSRWFHGGTPAEVRAVDGVTLTVEAGGFLLVTGPSGSGKTTLLALLGGLEFPTAGTVLVGGEDVARMGEGARSRLRRRMGFAFAAAPLLPRMSVRENVTCGLVPRGVAPAERRRRADLWLERLGLAARAAAAAEELSTGERQRAGLARALVGHPEALIVDEPLANLDEGAAETVVSVLEEFHTAGGTVVVASHVTAPFDAMTPRLALEAGRSV